MKNTKFKLILLFLISLFPIVTGWFLYHYRSHFHFKTLNQGMLINPPIHLQEFENDKSWKIIYITSQCCDSQCQKTLFILHQLRLVLGKDARRVSLKLGEDHICPKEVIHDFKRIDGHSLKQALQSPIYNKIYLVDPLGNLFMYYPDTVDAMHILKDLKRVLEVSQVG